MLKQLKGVLIVLACVATAIVLASCGAGAPAPPVEMPSPIVLKLVEFDELQIDLGKLTGGALTSLAPLKLNNPGQTYTDIGFNADRIKFYEEEILIPITEGIGAIDIPVGKNIHSFEGEVTFTQLSELILDTFFGTHNVKLDFSDYDFDGNGETEHCTGNTAELPVCVRFWLDDQRFIAWVFEEYPVREDNPATDADERTVGKGRFKIQLDNIYGIGWEIAVQYGQTLGENESKGYDAFLKGTINDNALVWFAGEDPFKTKIWRTHVRVLRDGPEATALKFVDSNDLMEALFNNTTPMTAADKRTDRYVEGFDFWAGSFYRDLIDEYGVKTGEGEQDMCANISTQITIEPSMCEDVGGRSIRIGVDPLFPEDGHPFISTPTEADTLMPADFPAAPPAGFPFL